jgi:hypothetical protein
MDVVKLFIPITKVDEAKREVWGTLTQEIGDRDDEVFDYESSKPFFEEWSKNVSDATDGKSLGNVREMHQPMAAGKLIALSFDDGKLIVKGGVKVVDDAAWEKCREGVYSGFSMGGRYVKKWPDPKNPKLTRFTADPYEVSLVDYPAVPTATFDLVKANGATEVRKFKKVAARDDVSASEGKNKYGDVTFADEKNKKYPIDTKSHVRAALAYFGVEENRKKYSDTDIALIGAKIRAAAKKFGIEASEKAMLAGAFSKGLWDLGRLASIIQDLCWLRDGQVIERDIEGDDSAVPDDLTEYLNGLLGCLEDMCTEEVGEARDDANKNATKTAATTKAAGSTITPTSQRAAAMKDTEFKKMRKEHVAKLDGIAEHANAIHTVMGNHVSKCEGTEMHPMAKALHSMIGDHCEKIAGFQAEVGGMPTTETTGSDDKGVADTAGKAAMAKVTGERDEALQKMASLEKRASEAETALKTTKDELAKTQGQLDEAVDGLEVLLKKERGKLVGADRTNDGDPDLAKRAAEKKKLDDDLAKLPEGERARAAFKAAMAAPTFSNGFGKITAEEVIATGAGAE